MRIEELSVKLGKGFSRSNLQNMRLFYLNYPKNQKLSGKLSWSHYSLLLGVSNKLTRLFYEKEEETQNRITGKIIGLESDSL